MAVKTITVTEGAYHALKSWKNTHESFSETILRLTGQKSLRGFAGMLSEESAEKIERTIKEMRHRHMEVHKNRIKRIVKAFRGH